VLRLVIQLITIIKKIKYKKICEQKYQLGLVRINIFRFTDYERIYSVLNILDYKYHLSLRYCPKKCIYRTDSIMAEQNWISSSCGRLNFEGRTVSDEPFSQWSQCDYPLQVLRDGSAQKPEWLLCFHSAVHDGECGSAGLFLLKSTIISTVLSVFSSRLL